MNIFWEELTAGLTNHDQLLRVFIRLFAAILLGGLMGLQRVSARKPSGLRIHTLICLGTTVVLLSCSAAGISLEGASRVIQGIVTGIGFIGAGSILKLSEDHLVSGLTVSTRIWATAAVGIAIGLGHVGIALIVAVLIILVLGVLRALERGIERRWRVTPGGSPYDSRP
ncbi:MAG TPA: MgtC/SapB family protein [Candidatus Udaeobacter sp.]|jgi:putative Mg2+ transporter-C (MgtC) family protein